MSLTPQESRLLGKIAADVATLVKRDDDKEDRIRSLERKDYVHSGVVLALSLFAAPVLSIFGIKLPGH